MAELPNSLSIAIWLTASIWLVAIVGHLLGAPHEIVYFTFAAGIVVAAAEWIAFKRHGR